MNTSRSYNNLLRFSRANGSKMAVLIVLGLIGLVAIFIVMWQYEFFGCTSGRIVKDRKCANMYPTTAATVGGSFAGRSSWPSLACSSDGSKVYTLGNGILASTDYGMTWKQIKVGNYTHIECTPNGTKLFAARYRDTEGISVSEDSGATWTDRPVAGRHGGSGLAIDSTGTKIVTSGGNKSIFTSRDSGATWRRESGSEFRNNENSWMKFASNSDGTRLIASKQPGYIYTSANSGTDWKQITGLSAGNWFGKFASSSDGKILHVAKYDSYIYSSTDYGVTWIQRKEASKGFWFGGIACSADGTKLITGSSNDYIITSKDSGKTWTRRTSTTKDRWESFAISADGTKLFAGGGVAVVADGSSNGYIWSSIDSGETWRVSRSQADAEVDAATNAVEVSFKAWNELNRNLRELENDEKNYPGRPDTKTWMRIIEPQLAAAKIKYDQNVKALKTVKALHNKL